MKYIIFEGNADEGRSTVPVLFDERLSFNEVAAALLDVVVRDCKLTDVGVRSAGMVKVSATMDYFTEYDTYDHNDPSFNQFSVHSTDAEIVEEHLDA